MDDWGTQIYGNPQQFHDVPKQGKKRTFRKMDFNSAAEFRTKDISQPGAFCALKPLWSKVLDPIIPEHSGHGTESQDAKIPRVQRCYDDEVGGDSVV